MIITKVRAENFLSFRAFDVSMTDGLRAVVGENRDAPGARSNGAGKSSIVDAIAWCLFGHTTRGLIGDDVVNLDAKKDCMTEVEFDDGHRIIRYRKHKTGKNSLHIFDGNKRIMYDRVKDAQLQVETLLGMDWDTFRQAVLFGQDAVRFLALTDSEKKEIIERILGAEVLDKAGTEARSRMTAAKTAETQAERDRRLATITAESKGNELVTLKKAEAEAQARRDEDKARLRKEAADLQKEKADAERKTLNEIDLGEAQLKVKRAEAEKAEKDSERLATESKYADDDLKKASDVERAADKAHSALESRMDELAQRVEAVKSLKADCHTCHQPISKEHVQSVLAGLTEEYDQWNPEWVAARNEALRQTEKVGDASMKAGKADGDAGNAREAAYGARRAFEKSESGLEGLRDDLKDDSDHYRGRIEKLHSRLRLLLDTKPEFAPGAVDQIASEAKEARLKATEAGEAEEKAKEQGKKMEFWAEGFGLRGLRSMLLDGVLPFVEKRANGYLKDLTGGTFRLGLSPISAKKGGKHGETRDAISVSLASSHAGDSYKSLSGGERQRVDIAVALALFDLARARAGADIGLAVFDEVFERLDDAGCEAVGALLRKNASRWGSVLLVTHLDGLLSEVPDRISVVKDNGESRIQEVANAVE